MSKLSVRRSTAIHEAGHAVAAIALRRRFLSVTIEPEGDSLGHVRITPPKSDAGFNSHFDHLVRLLAGVQAEWSFGYRPRHIGASADRSAALDHADAISGDSDEARLWVRLATIRSRSLVELWRPSIEALADQLMEVGTIKLEEARRVALQARGVRL
jgi:hypothetical protein